MAKAFCKIIDQHKFFTHKLIFLNVGITFFKVLLYISTKYCNFALSLD